MYMYVHVHVYVVCVCLISSFDPNKNVFVLERSRILCHSNMYVLSKMHTYNLNPKKLYAIVVANLVSLDI